MLSATYKLFVSIIIYAECHYFCLLSLMLSATYKPFMLSVIMLSVVMLRVVMLSVVMLNVVMLCAT